MLTRTTSMKSVSPHQLRAWLWCSSAQLLPIYYCGIALVCPCYQFANTKEYLTSITLQIRNMSLKATSSLPTLPAKRVGFF